MKTIKFRGFTFDPVTPFALVHAEGLAGFEFRITQGSYSTVVAASSGTHDRGGCVDFSVRGLPEAKIAKAVKALRDSGFAAWHRVTSQGFAVDHIHAVLIGCPDLAPIAARQVIAYDAHRNGLKSNEPDPSYRPSPKVRFDMRTRKPVPRGLPAPTPSPKPGPKPTPPKK